MTTIISSSGCFKTVSIRCERKEIVIAAVVFRKEFNYAYSFMNYLTPIGSFI